MSLRAHKQGRHDGERGEMGGEQDTSCAKHHAFITMLMTVERVRETQSARCETEKGDRSVFEGAGMSS